MTLSKRDVYLRAAFRRVWRWEPNRRALKAKGTCEECGKKGLRGRQLHVDHIEPVVPTSGFVSWDDHYKRIFEGKQRALCVPCHKIKTSAEGKIRRAVRAANKRKPKA